MQSAKLDQDVWVLEWIIEVKLLLMPKLSEFFLSLSFILINFSFNLGPQFTISNP